MPTTAMSVKEDTMSFTPSRRALLSGAAAGMLGLAACQPSAPLGSGSGGEGVGEHPSLAYLPSTQPANWSAVIGAVNEKMKADIGTTLDAQFLNWSQYAQQVLLKFTAAETFDSALNARWMNMVQLVSSNSLADLTDEIGKHENLSKALAPELIEANKWSGRLWGIPQVNGAARIHHFGYRDDLAAGELTDFDSFLKYLSDVKQKNPDITPFELHNNVGLNQAITFSPLTWEDPQPVSQAFSGGSIGVAINPDDPTDIRPVYESEHIIEGIRVLRDLYEKGLVNKDALTLDSATANSQFAAGRFAAHGVITDGLGSQSLKTLQAAVPGASLANLLPYRDGLAAKPFQTFQSDNFAVINPAGHVDRALQIQDWLSIQENHDMLAYGIEGTDWTASGEDKYEALSDYVFPGFALLWRIDLERMPSTISASEEEIFAWSKKFENFTLDPLATFYPDVTPVKKEDAELTNVATEHLKPLCSGAVDVDAGLDALRRAAEAAGIEKVMEEMRTQISAHLAEQG